VSLGVLFVDRPFGWGSQAKDFVHEPEAQLWFFAIALQGALWTVLTVPVRDALRELAPFRRRSAAVLAGSAMTAGIAALAAGSRLAGPKYPLPGHLAKVLLLTAWGYCVALGATVAIWRVATAAKHQFPPSTVFGATEIARYLRLRELLDRLLAIEGAILGAAILATAALRLAINADPSRTQLPFQEVLVYGVFLSGLLALVYAPPFLRLRTLGERIRETVAPLPSPSDDAFSEKLGRRTELTTLLRLEASASGSFKAGVAILTPLATSVVGLLLAAPK